MGFARVKGVGIVMLFSIARCWWQLFTFPTYFLSVTSLLIPLSPKYPPPPPTISNKHTNATINSKRRNLMVCHYGAASFPFSKVAV